MVGLLAIVAVGVVVPALGRRATTAVARYRRWQRAAARREELAAVYWAAKRHRSRGTSGDELQEAVCRELGCCPHDADLAIELLDVVERARALRRRV